MLPFDSIWITAFQGKALTMYKPGPEPNHFLNFITPSSRSPCRPWQPYAPSSHLSPGCTGTGPCAGRPSCAPCAGSRCRGRARRAGWEGASPPGHWCRRPPPIPGGEGRPPGAPPPASGSSDAPDPRRAEEIAEKGGWIGLTKERQMKDKGRMDGVWVRDVRGKENYTEGNYKRRTT